LSEPDFAGLASALRSAAMDDDDFSEQIAQLEARSEALAVSIERCRKFSLAAKFTIAAGVIYIVLAMLSVISYTSETTITAIAAMIIGTVLLGSNATTWTQAEAALHAAEAARADLIERMQLRVVGEEKPTLH
jgi:hypothetical protein